MRPEAISKETIKLLAIATIKITFCSGSSYMGCIESEREALLKFKGDIKDPSKRLGAWTRDSDCCTWAGVICNNLTFHVQELHLRNPNSDDDDDQSSMLGGKINPSLLAIKHLIYLDLSYNNFEGVQIPTFLGSMRNLRYLNLSEAGFMGPIPPRLGNLSNLQYLDLRSVIWELEMYVHNLNWLSGLSLLEYLDLTGVNLSNASDWLLSINNLPRLTVLKLSDCKLHHFPVIPSVNFSSLAVLDLDSNMFDKYLIPSWVSGLYDLVYLSLQGNPYQGLIPEGLQNLTSLRHLDLTSVDFSSSSIPNWLYKFSRLEYLSLSSCNFSGQISGDIGNLTSLKTLDLSANFELQGKIPRSFERLCNLKSITLSNVNLNQEISEILNIFSGCVSVGLESLDLSHSQLFGHLNDQLGQLKKVETLDLSSNNISGHVPLSLGDLSSLRILDLSHNKLNQEISEILNILSGCVSVGLEWLDLRDNQLFGHLTDQLRQLKNVDSLYLSSNNISGAVPMSLGELSSLKVLDLSYNKLNGTLFEIHFNNLASLQEFRASENSLMLTVGSEWIPPFQLTSLELISCHLGPQIPLWLSSQKVLGRIDMSNTKLFDRIPTWLLNSSSLYYLNLSHNQIHGVLPRLTTSISVLDLSSNNLSGPFPLIFTSNLLLLDLSDNAFSGSIYNLVCNDIKDTSKLFVFKLRNNLLSGQLPNCWSNWTNLRVLNLDNNKFTGNLPTSLGINSLLSLHLRKNHLFGTIPRSFGNCRSLLALDLGENELVGNVPNWIGESFSDLRILNLHSNKFQGLLPLELCSLRYLHILDLADNNLSGGISGCVSNFSVMVAKDKFEDNIIKLFGGLGGMIVEDALLVMKGKADEYITILNLVRMIDLSRNNLSGKFPEELTNLAALQSLNLSQNSFTGKIPKNIGAMKSLESIDLSANQLSGKIPQSISGLSFLSHLNLSNNNLTGEIPLSTQLQGFDPSCFVGNELCGSPLPTCPQKHEIENEWNQEGNEHEVKWFYLSMALGFVIGFWGFVAPLFFSRRWRHTYYGFLDHLFDRLYIIIVRIFY